MQDTSVDDFDEQTFSNDFVDLDYSYAVVCTSGFGLDLRFWLFGIFENEYAAADAVRALNAGLKKLNLDEEMTTDTTRRRAHREALFSAEFDPNFQQTSPPCSYAVMKAPRGGHKRHESFV